jgi:integrase
MNSTQILTREEVRLVLANLEPLAEDSFNAKLNLTIFRMVTGCGLRVSELCNLRVTDVVTESSKPCIYVISGKGGKNRVVSLSWDIGTLEQVRQWARIRVAQKALPSDPFLVSSRKSSRGRYEIKLHRIKAYKRWKTAIKVLGPERVRQLSIHAGRHTFCSMSLAAGRTLVEIKEAAGHANISTTSIYLHTLENTKACNLYS